MLLIYSPVTSRSRYVFELVFKHLIPVPYRLTDDPDVFRRHDGPRLTYGDSPIENGGPFFRCAPLLTEQGIRRVNPEPFDWEGTLGLFPVDDERSAFPFDPFAAAFFLVTRYEEYTSPERDDHGRFPPEKSVLFQTGFLRKPVVNEYAVHLRDLLSDHYPDYDWPRLPFSALSTIDIDMAYAYRGRSYLWNVASAVRHLLRGEDPRLSERLQVLRGEEDDPYDTYDWLHRVHEEYCVPLTYFALVGDRGPLDRNLPSESPEMASLISSLAETADVGLHPSYRSNSSVQILESEVHTLEKLTGKPVSKSRQHFLKLNLPESYRNLIECGLTEDYSMGYAAEPGFRAGIAASFPFFDLESDEPTTLTIYPLAIMDATLHYYMKLSPDEAIEVIDELVSNVRRCGGMVISLWHNNSVSDQAPWLGWRQVFKHCLEMMSDTRGGTGDAIDPSS